jgi:hypothetical protein
MCVRRDADYTSDRHVVPVASTLIVALLIRRCWRLPGGCLVRLVRLVPFSVFTTLLLEDELRVCNVESWGLVP